ncbi:MAG TPA: hypothetical protein VFX59_08135 [Polyangiales bacterium]|nr:hypothetical protein [Polyangiales bacterium]
MSTTLARSALRRRHVHALALFIRSQSKLAFDSRAFSHVQLAHLGALTRAHVQLAEDVLGPW